MIAKIITGKSFGGAVRYLLEKSGHARMIDSDGVKLSDIRSLIGSFNFQRKARPETAQVVGHISLSFHKDDTPRFTDGFMAGLAREYMQRMGITDTQYIVVRHTDTEHPHLHILYNRVKYDTKLVRSHNERIRSVAVCKAMKQKYGLTFSKGKENVKIERLHDPDKVKFRIYEAVKTALKGCACFTELVEQLNRGGVTATFIHRGGDPQKEIQGMTFTLHGQTLKASQVDRKFSYANLCKIIEQNKIEKERHKAATEHQQQEQTARNPVIYGVRLTDEQVEQIKDGQPVYLEGMQHEGKTFDGYLVMDDNLTRGRAYIGHDPREWVEYGKYTMRRMDRDLIKGGFVVRAFVQWWGGHGQTARPYLWEENPSDETYQESWDDPRKPRTPRHDTKQGKIVSSPKKSKGSKL